MNRELAGNARILSLLQPFGLLIIGSLRISDRDSVPDLADSLPARQMVLVGNAGNGTDAGNALDPSIFGTVTAAFEIGKYEVTNDEYTAFLNAVAATDPNGIYDPNMATNPINGIVRAGVSGSYEYYARRAKGKKPVGFVNWFVIAIRPR